MHSSPRDDRHRDGESPIKIVKPQNSLFQYHNVYLHLYTTKSY